jgi:hypothetical protein
MFIGGSLLCAGIGSVALSNARTLRLPSALPTAAGCQFTLCTLVWEAHP